MFLTSFQSDLRNISYKFTYLFIFNNPRHFLFVYLFVFDMLLFTINTSRTSVFTYVVNFLHYLIQYIYATSFYSCLLLLTSIRQEHNRGIAFYFTRKDYCPSAIALDILLSLLSTTIPFRSVSLQDTLRSSHRSLLRSCGLRLGTCQSWVLTLYQVECGVVWCRVV